YSGIEFSPVDDFWVVQTLLGTCILRRVSPMFCDPYISDIGGNNRGAFPGEQSREPLATYSKPQAPFSRLKHSPFVQGLRDGSKFPMLAVIRHRWRVLEAETGAPVSVP